MIARRRPRLRHWDRLGFMEIGEFSAHDRLQRAMRALEGDGPIAPKKRADAAWFLRALLDSPDVLRRLVGVERTYTSGEEIALDYLVSQELGGGKALAARDEVAIAWGVDKQYVADCRTEYGKAARGRLEVLLLSASDNRARPELLQAIRDDLRDFARQHGHMS